MIVSLEAIFLSTFVMISQNRADAKRQVIADQQWQTVKEEDRQNEELLELSRQILDLTKAIHAETPRARPPKDEATLRVARLARGRRCVADAADDCRTLLAARNAAVAAVWHRRRAGFVVQLSTTERR